MGRGFIIILNKKYSVKHLDEMIEEVVDIETKYKISNKNHIIISRNANIMFDVEKEIIKGRIYEKSGEKEKKIIENMIKKIGKENMFVHFYGKENFLSTNNINII